MSAKKPNIQQIQDYLNGKLDARAMHKLERQAQDDPMLWDVLKGMESADAVTHQANLDTIDQLINQRVGRDSVRVIPMWKVASVAASLLIALGVGGWLLTDHQTQPNIAVVNKPNVTLPDQLKVDTPVMAKSILPPNKPVIAQLNRSKAAPATIISAADKPVTKPDTALSYFIASNHVDTNRSRPGKLLRETRIKSDVADASGYSSVATISAKDIKAKNAKMLDTSLSKLLSSTPPNIVIEGRNAQKISDKKDTTLLNRNLLSKVAGVQVSTLDAKSRAYTQMITGRVFDKDSHEILPGASVMVDGSTTATQTDAEGKFAIAMPAGKEKLNIGYVGYGNQQVTVKSRDSVNVTLAPNSAMLMEVSIAGSGEAKKAKSFPKKMQLDFAPTAYDKYLKDNAIMPDGRTGIVKVSFTVEANGTISNITIVKGLADDMNQKAIQLIKNGPAWAPQTNGKPHLVTLDIQFHK